MPLEVWVVGLGCATRGMGEVWVVGFSCATRGLGCNFGVYH